MVKTGKIIDIVSTGDWTAPNGDIIYYHRITLDNNESGVIGAAEEYPDKLKKGKKITYTESSPGRFKLSAASASSAPANRNTPRPPQSAASNDGYPKKSYGKKPDDFLGYACSYAKDLVVAGKASKKDIDLYKSAAQEIYTHIVELLRSEQPN